MDYKWNYIFKERSGHFPVHSRSAAQSTRTEQHRNGIMRLLDCNMASICQHLSRVSRNLVHLSENVSYPCTMCLLSVQLSVQLCLFLLPSSSCSDETPFCPLLYIHPAIETNQGETQVNKQNVQNASFLNTKRTVKVIFPQLNQGFSSFPFNLTKPIT